MLNVLICSPILAVNSTTVSATGSASGSGVASASDPTPSKDSWTSSSGSLVSSSFSLDSPSKSLVSSSASLDSSLNSTVSSSVVASSDSTSFSPNASSNAERNSSSESPSYSKVTSSTVFPYCSRSSSNKVTLGSSFPVWLFILNSDNVLLSFSRVSIKLVVSPSDWNSEIVEPAIPGLTSLPLSSLPRIVTPLK